MSHSGYFIDSIASTKWFRCLQCPYDAFSEESIRDHVKYAHPKYALPEEGTPTSDWVAQHKGLLPRTKIGISLLTWNTRDASEYAALQIAAEKQRLASLGVESVIIWADNGSTDGTVKLINQSFDWIPDTQKRLFPTNLGQSHARNVIIDAAKEQKCDFLLMVDGDIEITPYSAFAMARYLKLQGKDIGCIGMYCRNSTHELDPGVATECRRIEPWMVDSFPEIAWTNYGMFRSEVFNAVKFDESGPFAGPGWGFEDDDYQMQMAKLGFKSVNSKYFRHLHRRRHSSLKILNPALAAKVYAERKAYLLKKWADEPSAKDHITLLANQTMPVLEY